MKEQPSQFGRVILAQTKTYLFPSLISCFFCILPGLVAVYYGFKVRAGKQIAGRLEPEEVAEILVASGKARFFMILSYILGAIGIIVQIFRISN